MFLVSTLSASSAT